MRSLAGLWANPRFRQRTCLFSSWPTKGVHRIDSLIKRLAELAIILIFLGISSWGQEVTRELTVQASGLFTKQTSEHRLSNKRTNSAGVMAGLRFNLKRRLSVEGDYDYFRNDQKFLSSGGTRVLPMNVHAATGVAIVKLPTFKALSPFVLGGDVFRSTDRRICQQRPDSRHFRIRRWCGHAHVQTSSSARTIPGICLQST